MEKARTALLIVSLLALAGVGCKSKKNSDDNPARTEEASSAAQPSDDTAEESGPAAEDQNSPDQPDDHGDEQDGQWVESDAYDLKFRVPADWDVTENDEGVSAVSTDGSTTVLLAGSESQRLATSMLNDIRSDLTFKDIEVQESGPTTVNGMAAFRGSGAGVIENDEGGDEIQFLGYVFKRPGDQNATLFIFSDAAMYEARKEMIRGIAQTLVETTN